MNNAERELAQKELREIEEKAAKIRLSLDEPKYMPKHADYGFDRDERPCFTVKLENSQMVDCSHSCAHSDCIFGGAYHINAKVGNIIDDLIMIKREPPTEIVRSLHNIYLHPDGPNSKYLKLDFKVPFISLNHKDRKKLINALRQWDWKLQNET